ncbi:unnamed protein product [Musa acuminata var. zebrina]
MAGQAVLSAFMQVLFEKVITAAVDEFRLLRGVRGELQNLATTLSTIQALLEDAEEKQLQDKSVRHWLAKLKDVAYDMDGLLDECAAAKIRWEMESRARRCSWKMQVSGCFSHSCWHRSSYHYNLAHRTKAVQERFDRIATERHNLGLQVSGGISQLQITERPQTSSLEDDLKVLGREEDREALISMLLSANNSGHTVTVLPIIGMGGLGKTTLAKSVYNDHRIKQHFQLRMWVCVSENFDETKLTRETLESATREFYATTTNMTLIQEDLFEQLQGKRFLLVLDDVWNEDPIKWYRYRNAIIGGERGSKILVTTRNENVGRIMGGWPPYRLKQLSDDDCWELFRNYAFVGWNSSTHPNLEKIGKMIVKNLKGLPLAAMAIGSLLFSKLEEEEWKSILRSEIWELPADKNNILPALRLSYKQLPSHLKQCFVFCSVFHKDFVFDKDRLVKTWMALGFIQPTGGKRMEDIGSSYFDELVSRSFFQSHKGYYVMHDAIHDLAQSLSVEECHRLECGLRNVGLEKKIRHLSFSCTHSMATSVESFFKFKKLRSLLLLKGYKSRTGGIPDELFLRLKCLRVLKLRRRDIEELPNSIGSLIQLRYLDLANTGIRTLPQSISKLYNLQTLILRNCNFLSEIPCGITNLIHLRHLEATSTLISGIAGLGCLTCLQELERFVVRKNGGFKITELQDMNELRGHLCIQNLESVVDRKEAGEANLHAKEHLSFLSLEWTKDRDLVLEDDILCEEEVLEDLQPHHELRELKVMGYAGTKLPSWIGNPSFCYLETIHLSNLMRCKHLPPLGQLPLLRYLDIGGVPGLVRIGQEFHGRGDIKGFPSLIELVLEDMPALEEWVCSDDDELLPCLTDLGIADCSNLRELPCLPPTIERLRISGVGLTTLPDLRGSNCQFSSLNVYDCPNLTSLQKGLLGQQLKAIEQLAIVDCEELILLPPEGFKDLVSLKSLSIYNCPKLVPLEDDKRLLPRSLTELRISSCSKLINRLLADCKDLASLKHLRVTDCADLYRFPEEGLPTALESLGVFRCYNLLLLPAKLQELHSLKSMVIDNCHQVQCSPEEGLPMELKELLVRGCPLLKEYCLGDGAAGRHQLMHIPRVQFDDVLLRN